ncbi:UNVERIFIED_CONTAM: hypothetical protein Sangu_2457400 [Sesamum angustifolium]|uniref:Aminotransferase-like plant mobile domain-containing protein n=1 Tax=Sesamum angustifolium TaxID=2727405 RepID=A0AAW2KT21_9LAMI
MHPSLAVYAPLVSLWSRLTNSSHLGEWCREISLSKNIKAWTLRATHHKSPRHQPAADFAHLCTLSRFIIKDVLSRCEDKLRLINTYDVVYASLFTYNYNYDIIKAFCEAWCPLTKTFLTSTGELSISLWDLHELAGLPMTGFLYDEVVPNTLEFTDVDEKRERFIPCSSKYLIYSYHLLQSAYGSPCSNLSIDKRVWFWSKEDIKYHLPPSCKEKKVVRPKLTHNPLHDIATHERRSTAEEALFVELCIKRNLKEEDYLAIYLACWLCVFALADEDVNFIYPSTLEMTSMTASDRRVNLAIPVLRKLSKSLLEQQLREAKDRFQDAQGPIRYGQVGAY